MAGAIKGRGALSQPPGRFDKLTQTLEHDGWYEDEQPDKRETVVLPEPARSVISRNQSPDIHFQASINPYRGCEHGCIYCARGDTSSNLSVGIFSADGSSAAISTSAAVPSMVLLLLLLLASFARSAWLA